MAWGNEVTLVGNITREPELRYTPSGQAVVKFGLAWNNNWTDRITGEKHEEAHFFDVTAWRQLGERVAESLTKGDRVIVAGRLKHETWTTEAGENRSRVSVEADAIGPDLRWATVQITKAERQEWAAETEPAA